MLNEEEYIPKQSDETATGAPERPAGSNSLQASEKTPPDCPRRKRPRKRRVSLGEAMRACGLDEHAIAGMYKRVLRSLHESEPKLGAKVQFLKECARLLDAKQTGRGSRSGNQFRAVKLIHKVPRPVRGETPPKATS
jgi:hypothetical protein